MYRGNFPLFAGISLALSIPGLLLNLLTGNYKTFGLFFSAFSDPGAFYRQVGVGPEFNLAYLAAGYGLILLVVPFTAGANIQAATDIATGRPTSIAAVFNRVRRRYFGIYGVVALVGLMFLTFITCVLIPLTIWILVSWSMAIPVLLLEGAEPRTSLRRSRALVRGNWWRLFAIFVVTYFLAAIISSAVGALVGGLAALVPGLSADARGGVLLAVLAVASALTEPVFPIVVTLLYFDLRVRNEALDLDVLAQRAAVASSPAAAPTAASVAPAGGPY